MKILNVELVASAAAAGTPGRPVRDDVPQFAFVGRSNVGKSSLLNALTRRKVARTSAAPGKTRLAHVYLVTAESGPGGPGTWRTYLVDLPGYGYARGNEGSVRDLSAVVERYFASGMRTAADAETTPHRRGVFLLVDARHPGLPIDVQAHQWLTDVIGPPQIVATKVDKLSQSERVRNLREIERVFGTRPIAVSVLKGTGLDDLWRAIAEAARGPAPFPTTIGSLA